MDNCTTGVLASITISGSSGSFAVGLNKVAFTVLKLMKSEDIKLENEEN